MDTQLKEKFVAALRSDKFKQGQNRLRENDAYCCLGVLCVVAGLGINEPFDQVLRPDGTRSDEGSYAVLNETGLEASQRGHLIDMNDGGKSFFEIADYIEQNL